MRYISDDGKVFNTEHECLNYENKIKEEAKRKEEIEKKRKEASENITKHYRELCEEIAEYEKIYKIHLDLDMNKIMEFLFYPMNLVTR